VAGVAHAHNLAGDPRSATLIEAIVLLAHAREFAGAGRPCDRPARATGTRPHS
jgi:hypothetical protein